MGDVLISVVVITYNQEKTIARTLDSIINQKTNYKYEIIIGEDSSSDGTRSVCEEYQIKYPDIIVLLPKAPNKGLMGNYADCVASCRGKYVSQCAGDDWWGNENKLELQASVMEKHNDVGLVFGATKIHNLDKGTVYDYKKSDIDIENRLKNTYQSLLQENFITALTVMFRKSLFDNYVNLDQYKELGFMMEDFPMWLEMSNHTKFNYIPKILANYVIEEGSISNCRLIENKIKFIENTAYIKEYFLNKYPKVKYSKDEIIRNLNLQKSYAYAINLDRKNAFQFALKATMNIKNIIKIILFSNDLTFKIYKKLL